MNKTLKIVIPLIIGIVSSFIFIWMYFKFSYVYISKPNVNVSESFILPEIKNVCNNLEEWKDTCFLAMMECKENPAPVNCIASQVFATTHDLNITEKICKTLEGSAIYFCLAEAVLPNLNLSLKICDKIEDIYEKVHCRADQLAKMNDINSALKECDKIDEIYPRLLCRASAYGQVDIEKAKKECNKISDEKIKNVCFELYGRQ